MIYSGSEIIFLLFVYSFIAWMFETAIATIHKKRFQNRGFVAGPFCFVYGFTAVILTIFLQELRGSIMFLFLGSFIIATVIEWITGKLLERMKLKKWWDYSGRKFNLDGYVCLQYSVLWGILGVLVVKYGNDFVVGIYRFLPNVLKVIIITAFLVVGGIDMLGNTFVMYHFEEKIPKLFKWNRALNRWTTRFGSWLGRGVNKRIAKVYPNTIKEKVEEGMEEHSALVNLFWFFVIGAFLGDIVETIFCRVKAGIWMSRSSLVWGPFSIVWGLAIALATALLHKDKDKSDRYIFMVGTLMGGAYEYVCSVFTEIVFGKVFWDYSKIPFNLGGRINLLYCFFWGIAAVVWIKLLYPKMLKMVEWIKKKTGVWITIILMIFMVVNMLVSILALVRYESRAQGVEAKYKWEKIIDERFNDERMKSIYPNAKRK